MSAADVGFGVAVALCTMGGGLVLAYRFVPSLRRRVTKPEPQHSCPNCQGSGIQFRFTDDGTPEMVFCADLKRRPGA